MRKLIFIIFAFIVFVITCTFIAFNFFVVPKKYKNYVIGFCNEYNLDKSLVYAIIKVESNFDNNATSSAGAMGLMQLMPSTAKWISSELKLDYNNINLYDPETNINFGCFYLHYLFQKFNNMNAVICSYNAGETVVKNWLDENGNLDENKISIAETQNYYKKVTKYYNLYSNKNFFE